MYQLHHLTLSTKRPALSSFAAWKFSDRHTGHYWGRAGSLLVWVCMQWKTTTSSRWNSIACGHFKQYYMRGSAVMLYHHGCDAVTDHFAATTFSITALRYCFYTTVAYAQLTAMRKTMFCLLFAADTNSSASGLDWLFAIRKPTIKSGAAVKMEHFSMRAPAATVVAVASNNDCHGLLFYLFLFGLCIRGFSLKWWQVQPRCSPCPAEAGNHVCQRSRTNVNTVNYTT